MGFGDTPLTWVHLAAALPILEGKEKAYRISDLIDRSAFTQGFAGEGANRLPVIDVRDQNCGDFSRF